MHIVQVNYAFDAALSHPEALLDRYTTLTGWSEAVAEAGASRVTVVQQFAHVSRMRRRGIEYLFRPGTRAVHRAVADLSPDVVHVNGLVFPVQTWRLRTVLPHATAIVSQDHASSAPDPPGTRPLSNVRRAVQARCLGAVDGFLFSTLAHAEPWRRAGLVSPWHSVYEVMEASTTLTAIPRATARKDTGIDGTPALLWVGRLNANKDPLTVLTGFERVLERLPSATLTMAYSEGPLLPKVRAVLSRSRTLSDRVLLRGRVFHDDMALLYSAADLFVLGSHHEGSGYALLEACACGAVPVVTDIPSFRAITRNGSIGRLWRPDDAEGFAAAVLDVAREDLGRSRARVRDHFDGTLSWRVVGHRAVSAYRDVIKRRTAAGALPH